ncbi:MAG: hypothetical protein FWE36_04730, partial [Erysipelotrichales bacterium]|nr:hypothetical protein [Erysipelotrichales bacterium]
MSLIRKNTRHLTDTVGGITGIIDLNPIRNAAQNNLFLDIPLLNMFDDFFNFRLFFDLHQRNETASFFGIGFNLDLDVQITVGTNSIIINSFSEERVFVREDSDPAGTFFHSDSLSRLIQTASFAIHEADGSIYTYNADGTLRLVTGTNNVNYTVSRSPNSTTPIVVSNMHGTNHHFRGRIEFVRGSISEPVTCINFRTSSTGLTTDYQIHFTYIRNRLTQIKYYYRGKYIQKTSINYELESNLPGGLNDNITTLELVDHNTKEHLKYQFERQRVRRVFRGIDEEYKYQKSLEISYDTNNVLVVNERKQKNFYGFKNDGSLQFEADNLGTASSFLFNNDDELIMQSSGILTNQAGNINYNLHNNPSFSGHARAVAVEGPFGRENATQVWLETSHNYSVGRNS